jgi:hypothetical protein
MRALVSSKARKKSLSKPKLLSGSTKETTQLEEEEDEQEAREVCRMPGEGRDENVGHIPSTSCNSRLRNAYTEVMRVTVHPTENIGSDSHGKLSISTDRNSTKQ